MQMKLAKQVRSDISDITILTWKREGVIGVEVEFYCIKSCAYS